MGSQDHVHAHLYNPVFYVFVTAFCVMDIFSLNLLGDRLPFERDSAACCSNACSRDRRMYLLAIATNIRCANMDENVVVGPPTGTACFAVVVPVPLSFFYCSPIIMWG